MVEEIRGLPKMQEKDLELRLQACAEQAGWNLTEQEKLKAYYYYYCGDLARAVAIAGRYVRGESFDLGLFLMCAIALYQNAQWDDALRILRGVPENNAELQSSRDYWVTRAQILQACNLMHELPEALDRMLELASQNSWVLENALSMSIELGQARRAQDIVEKLDALGVRGYSFSLCLLALGEDRGWEMMECRYEMEEAAQYLNPALLSLPRWRGEENISLLVSTEQGIGDAIQVARYFPLLAQRTSGRVSVEIQSELIDLFEVNFPELDFLPCLRGKVPPGRHERWLGLMSLPWVFGRPGERYLSGIPYLRVPEASADYWHKRASELFSTGVTRVGVAWSGQPRHRADRRRSIPSSQFFQYVQSSGRRVISLQKFRPASCPSCVLDCSDELLTFADTAALIAQLDVVVTVDTSIVHLAGALGKKCLLMLPYCYEWRWGAEGDRTQWYDSVMVIRQRSSGEWDSVLESVFTELDAMEVV
ncbi:hypothetical protein C0V76_11435 [Uliginosibacterium sp. TH139]|nr:hypothetical protein C0V76_11435 [Uliginosibacterium sp. TH139]